MSDNCEQFAVDLSVYFDGELQGEAAEAMERHLSVCEQCRASLDKMRRIRAAMHQMGGARQQGQQPRRSLVDEIMARLETGQHSAGA